jgi:hypothetical protein
MCYILSWFSQTDLFCSSWSSCLIGLCCFKVSALVPLHWGHQILSCLLGFLPSLISSLCDHSFGQYLFLSKQFEIRTLGDKQLFVWAQESCKGKQHFTKHLCSNLGRLAVIYTMIAIYWLLDRKELTLVDSHILSSSLKKTRIFICI